jgi:hypothetical protein
MVIDPELTVIGVFGSNTTKPGEVKDAELAAVELLAAEINRAGALLLTGAEPKENQYEERPDTVKDVAVYALRNSGAGPSAIWVGVARKDHAQVSRDHRTRGVVVTPGWDHRRNFVEACLCDAAIAVGGNSPGTASEALFCLYLGRPLTLVAHRSGGTQVSPRELRRRIGTRVRSEGDRLFVDIGIAGAYAWAETTSERVKERPLPTDEAGAARLVEKLLAKAPRHEPRPDFKRLLDTSTWNDYVADARQAAGRLPG